MDMWPAGKYDCSVGKIGWQKVKVRGNRGKTGWLWLEG